MIVTSLWDRRVREEERGIEDWRKEGRDEDGNALEVKCRKAMDFLFASGIRRDVSISVPLFYRKA